MPKRKPSFGRRAWSLVRLTLLRRDHVGYMMERELSFDDTPVVRVKMRGVNSKRFYLGGIDRRAEEFIAKFYEQMKLQR